MRCTNCSEEVKPVVAIDVDGVLGDYHGHFLRYACQYLGHGTEKLLWLSLPENMYHGYEHFSEYCMNKLGISLGEYRDIKLAYRQGAMKRSMPINEGATALCVDVMAQAELWITTTRPYLSLDGVIKDTTFWLDIWNIPYNGLLFDDDKYMVLAERVDADRVVAVLDDIDEMYDAAADLFGEEVPILFVNKYNGFMGTNRSTVNSLPMAGLLINDQLNAWRGKHA